MSDSNIISVTERVTKGKGAARAVRRSGLVPSIIYGGTKSPVALSLDPRIVMKGLESGHFFSTVYSVEVSGKDSEKAIVRDVQFHPVTDAPLHVDFMRVTDKTKVTLSIPVVIVGEDTCPGLKEGGLLSVVRHEVQVICRAADIPDEFVLDISGAIIGDTLKMSSIQLPDGVQPVISDRDFVIANLLAPKLVEDTVEAAEGEEGSDPADVPSDHGGDDKSDDGADGDAKEE